jgi:hypothetical protein
VTEKQQQEQSSWRGRFIALAGWAVFAGVAAVMCEVGARIDDWFFEDVPVLASPSFPALFSTDETGMRHGIPAARWKKVRLNNLGLRGPDVPVERRDGCGRWMFLGASETFGDPAQANKDYPARVRTLTSSAKCLEVLNTAFPALDLRSIIRYYQFYMSKYRPDVVFIYPPIHFYLGEVAPRNIDRPRDIADNTAPQPVSLLEKSRFFERLKDTAEVPAIIQKRRVQRWIAAAEQGHDDGWHFKAVPEDRLNLMSEDLQALIELVRASGAEPVLMTHAVRVASPPRAEDQQDLYAMRVYVPRATEDVLAAFEYAAAERVRGLATQTGTRLIDVAKTMNGRRERFVDLVHFSNEGNDEVAHLIVEAMNTGSHAVQ